MFEDNNNSADFDEDGSQQLKKQNTESDLFDLDSNDDLNDYHSEYFKEASKSKNSLSHGNLSIVKLDSISIPPIVNSNTPHILNLKQEFTFPVSNFQLRKEVASQTMSLIETRIKTPHPMSSQNEYCNESFTMRPQSVPASCISNHNLTLPRVTADVKPKKVFNNMCIGDGIENNLRQIKHNAIDFDVPEARDLEIADALPCKMLIPGVKIETL